MHSEVLMSGHCETFDHTTDVGLRARGDTLAELLGALAEGLSEVICPRGQVAVAGGRDLTIEAEDVEALTVDFLWEVMTTILLDHFAVSSVKVHQVSPKRVHATLRGERYDPLRNQLDAAVKTVTYSQLKVAQENGRWVARVILDV